MTTHPTPLLALPPAAVAPASADFDYIPWWTTTSLHAVLDDIDASTWCLLCDLVADPHSVSGQRLHGGTASVVRLIEALWMRRPTRHTPIPGNPQLPDRFAPLLAADLAVWRTLGRTGAAWCVARLATFTRHLHHPDGGCRHHRLGEVVTTAWRLLSHDEGSYLYTAALATRYDSDRPLDPQFVDALTAIARTHLAGRDTIELGAGTGAITKITAPHTRSLIAVEPAVGMRAIMRQQTNGLTRVQVRSEDCMSLDLDDASADVVFEHAALCFVDEPLFAVAEACRVLRPGGALVRIISSRHLPDPFTAFTTAFHAELRRRGHGRRRIVSSGNDARITDWLATAAITTQLDTIATWTSEHPLHRDAVPLMHGSYPYLATIPAHDRHDAIDAALTATKLDWNTLGTSTTTVVTATSILGGRSLPHPRGALR